jgi:hypothetical protein
MTRSLPTRVTDFITRASPCRGELARAYRGSDSILPATYINGIE